MLRQLRSLPNLLPVAQVVYRDPSIEPPDQTLRAIHLDTYQKTLAAARAAAISKDFGLVLVHLPVPHSPFIYNRLTGELSARAGPPYFPIYLDNLALADRTFGEIRQAMESAGMWELTTVLVTGDHSLRNAAHVYGRRDKRVPFILKLSGQRDPLLVSVPFNTVLTRSLFEQIEGGQLATHAAVADWLSARALPDSSTGTNVASAK